MSTGIVIGLRCSRCSGFVSPTEVIGDEKSGYTCWKCYQKHAEALKCLTGQPPRACQECHTPFSDLNPCDGNGKVRMFIHWKDGIYQVLCEFCSDRYAPKRLDLYGKTLWGLKRKLAGNK